MRTHLFVQRAVIGAAIALALPLTGFAQSYYFGLQHDMVGTGMLFPDGTNSVMVEGLPGSPDAGHLQISASTVPLVQLDSGLSVTLWSLYWGEGMSLALGAGPFNPNQPDPVYFLLIGPGPSPDMTALSVVQWTPQSGYLFQPMGPFAGSGTITDAVHVHLPPAELFGRLSDGTTQYARTRLAIGHPGLLGPLSGGHAKYQIAPGQKGGIADNPQFSLIFAEPVYSGLPANPPTLTQVISFYLPGGAAPVVSPMVLAASGDSGLVLILDEEHLIFQGVPISVTGNLPGNQAQDDLAVRGDLVDGLLRVTPTSSGSLGGWASAWLDDSTNLVSGGGNSSGVSVNVRSSVAGGSGGDGEVFRITAREGGRTIGAGQVTEILKLVNRPDGGPQDAQAGIRLDVLNGTKAGERTSFDVILKNGGAGRAFNLPINLDAGQFHLYIANMARPPRDPGQLGQFTVLNGGTIIMKTDGLYNVFIAGEYVECDEILFQTDLLDSSQPVAVAVSQYSRRLTAARRDLRTPGWN